MALRDYFWNNTEEFKKYKTEKDKKYPRLLKTKNELRKLLDSLDLYDIMNLLGYNKERLIDHFLTLPDDDIDDNLFVFKEKFKKFSFGLKRDDENGNKKTET